MSKIFKLGVVGNPIEHSLSPFIHSRFARNENISISYEAFKVEENNFNSFIKEFFSHKDSLGLNITLPFKKSAAQLEGKISEEAKIIAAVNTIKKESRSLYLDSTDGAGFIDDLKSKGVVIKNQKIMIIGAGAASESILYKIIEEKPKQIIINNRTEDKAVSLVKKYKSLFSDIDINVATNDQSDTSPDLIINGSSAGLTGQFSAPYLTTHKDQVFYDLNYSLEVTPFCDWAKAISPNVYDGIGMLVNQAAYSFNNWFGVKPNTYKALIDLKSL